MAVLLFILVLALAIAVYHVIIHIPITIIGFLHLPPWFIGLSLFVLFSWVIGESHEA